MSGSRFRPLSRYSDLDFSLIEACIMEMLYYIDYIGYLKDERYVVIHENCGDAVYGYRKDNRKICSIIDCSNYMLQNVV